MNSSLRLTVLLLSAPLAPAQALRWRLPPQGAAEYRRTWSAASAVAETPAGAQALVARGAVPERYLPRVAPAPWLCQGELRADQTGIGDPPRDLRDVVRAVACDFAGRGSWRFPRLLPFGDLLLTGSVGTADAAGVQTLRLAVARREVAALPGDDRELRERLRPLCGTAASGTLVITRTVDAQAGLVREFTAELVLFVDEGAHACRRIELCDHWTLIGLHENQDVAFRQQVGAAVRAGALWVRAALDGLDASYLHDKDERPPRSFGSGRLALAVQTLLHAEVPATDPVLAAALRELARRRLLDSYSLGVALLAMSARYAPPREAELVRDGTLPARQRRQLGDRDRALAERWLAQLLRNVDQRVDPAVLLRFNYTAGARCDNSIQQYGLLGLDAAALCGLPIPATAWRAAADQLLAAQCPANGRHVDLCLLTHRELQAGAAGRRVHAPARGFAYQDPEEPPYGSMTAAGLTGLVLARAGLLGQGARPGELRTVDEAIDAGFAWLAAEFTARANPGFAGRAHSHCYYWLYSLERACELAGLARLQGRDWYYEGALQLLAAQQPNGSFRSDDSLLLDATCFAVLFLKQATLPVVTGR